MFNDPRMYKQESEVYYWKLMLPKSLALTSNNVWNAIPENEPGISPIFYQV